MSVETVNGHVLLPHLPDWSTPVEWTRRWSSGVMDAVDGSEERVAVRTKGRHGLRFTVAAYNLQDRARLVNRLRLADKTGLVAVPFWGRGIRLAAAIAGLSTVTLAAPTPWTFTHDDPVFFTSPHADEFDAWEVRAFASLDGTALELDAPLTRSYPAGWFCWPVLLGHATHGDLDLRSDWHAAVQIEFRQLDARPDPPAWEDICWTAGPGGPWGSVESWNNYDEGSKPTPQPVGEDILLGGPDTVECWLSGWQGMPFAYGDVEHWDAVEWTEARGTANRPGTSNLLWESSFGAWFGADWEGDNFAFGGTETWEAYADGDFTLTLTDLSLFEDAVTGWAGDWNGETYS